MKRLFVAIDLPDWIKTELEMLCAFGVKGVKWVTREQMHLSLSFIGEVGEEAAMDISDTLIKVRAKSFEMSLNSVGTFPSEKTPRVIWAGIDKNNELMALQKKVASQLNQIGIKLERRKYSPHITLARVKSKTPGRIGEFLVQNSLYKSKPFDVTSFHLYLSTLTPKGAVYTKEKTYLF